MAYRNSIVGSFQPYKYLSAGVVTAAIEYAVFLLIIGLTDDALVSHIVSFIMAFHSSFLVNRLWVFMTDKPYTKGALFQYVSTAMLAGFNLLFSSLLFIVLMGVMPALIAKLGSMAMVALWTYIVMRNSIFSTR